MAQSSRPLSPHLQVYRMQITMTMSILHRITGSALFFGTALIVWWLVAAAMGDQALAPVYSVAGSWFGQLVLFGFVWALFNHLLGGMRHFVWDMGKGFSEAVRFGFAWGTLIGGLLLAVLTFVLFVWM